MEARSPEEWWEAGRREQLVISGVRRRIFVMEHGSGPWLTLLHGFPSSSHDWARVASGLAATYTLLAPDFLGFGASEKPLEHGYSLVEQADLVEAAWERTAVRSTAILAHDYGDSVAQELLARRAEGRLRVDLTRALLLNGGVYPGYHRPEPSQLALIDPERGPAISAAIEESGFSAALAPTFAASFDATSERSAIWRAMSCDGGQRNMHLLIRYMTDRARHTKRWTEALEHADLPVSFVWGMLDPVSGAPMAARIRERLPEASFTELAYVAHWPQLEAPRVVVDEVLGSTR